MDIEHETFLKKHYDFEQWRGRNTLQDSLFIWQFFLSGNELPDWAAHRIDPINVFESVRINQSIWQPSNEKVDGKTDTLLRLDVFECSSRLAAQEFLFRVLSDYQSTLAARQEQVSPGDVSFAGANDQVLLFVRANLVVQFRNAGRNVVSLANEVATFDQYLVATPVVSDSRTAPEIRRFEVVDRGENVSLEIDAVDVLARPLWYQFRVPDGEILAEEDNLIYRPSQTASQTITVFAINAEGSAASRQVRTNVR